MFEFLELLFCQLLSTYTYMYITSGRVYLRKWSGSVVTQEDSASTTVKM